ncbi:MAG TPA: hypothetical protein QF873_02350 [Patescibacteria group bacterium]|nr:hypothetical protein [Patescibacteria group bacterium]
MKDHLYNLMIQMVQEAKSLKRIESNYLAEADCDDCKAFWAKMKGDKEEHIKDLEKLIKGHM